MSRRENPLAQRRSTAAGVMLLRALAALALFVICAAPAIASRSGQPIFIAPAEDALLANLLLAGAGSKHPVLLFDPRDPEPVLRFVNERKGPIECFHRRAPAPLVAQMEEAAGTPCSTVDDLFGLARRLWPDATEAVAVRAGDHGWVLRAAAFAAAGDAALLIIDPTHPPLPEALSAWKLETLYLTPPAADWRPSAEQIAANVIEESSADSLTIDLLHRLESPPTAVVIANPHDTEGIFSPSSLSELAPLVSGAHRAPLVLVSGSQPEVVEGEVLAFLERHQLRPTHLILVGDELALRSHQVPDPVLAAGGPEARGGGTTVRVELFSGVQHEQPQELSVGRIVAEDSARASAVLARQLHRKAGGRLKPAIFLVNADEVFALGETISRTTASELRNVGVPVQAYYRQAITPEVIQRALKQTDVLVWEGHPRDLTLEERGGIAAEVAPDFVFLQGCYTLDRSDPFILMDKGTRAIVATSAAIYSAPGSAFARAFFDSVVYDNADLGTAVRNARNYLLALAQLQRARGHQDWHKTYRAALAFALWGDPTARIALKPRKPTLRPTRWSRAEDDLVLDIPRNRLRQASVGPYQARPVPRAMLSGLLLRQEGEEQRQVKELYFAAVETGPEQQAVCSPHEGWDLTTLYAPRTDTLFVLARPDWDILKVPPHGKFTFTLASDPEACVTQQASAE